MSDQRGYVLDDFEFVGVESAGFVQDRVRDVQLAEIMQQCGQSESVDLGT